MKKLTISVVIPAYNEERYIRNCLDSLKQQIDSPDEIIVVDNNSTDQTNQICRQYGVSVAQESRQGRVYAQCNGFNSAQSQIIARCDADCIIPPDWIKRIRYNFLAHTIDVLSGPFIYYDLPLKTPLTSRAYFLFFKVSQLGAETLAGVNMAITKAIWEKVKNDIPLNDAQIHEDIDLAIRLAKVGGRFYRDNQMVVQTSGRRIKENPISYFKEYPLKLFKTYYKLYKRSLQFNHSTPIN